MSLRIGLNSKFAKSYFNVDSATINYPSKIKYYEKIIYIILTKIHHYNSFHYHYHQIQLFILYMILHYVYI